MTNKTKALTKTSIAAALAVSALVPAAVASAATPATKADTVVFSYNGQLVSLSISDYGTAFVEQDLDGTQKIEYIVADNGEIYDISTYGTAFVEADGDLKETFKTLQADGSAVKNLEIKEGTIENGKVVTKDETPEEKVNETFFYNLAA